MKFEIEVGLIEKKRITVSRNWFTGSLSIQVNGQNVATKNPLNLGTHFSFGLLKKFPFRIGQTEIHNILVEHERPLLFAGFRPHKYRIFVDEQLIQEHRGY